MQSMLPGGLLSLSQIGSPIMRDSYLNRNLDSIEEEKTKEAYAYNMNEDEISSQIMTRSNYDRRLNNV